MEEDKQKTNIPSLQEAITGAGGLAPELTEKKSDGPKPYASSLKPLRTYQGDVNEAITDTKMSVAGIAIAEQKKRIETGNVPVEETAEDRAGKNKFYIMLGSLLLVLGILALASVYYINSQKPAQNNSQASAIISYSQQFTFPITGSTRESLIQTILARKTDFNLPINSVLYINVTNGAGQADVGDVLALLAPTMPGSLERNITGAYMIGIYSYDTNEPFIILKTDNYGESFAGMLAWEKTMVSDVGELFKITPVTGTTTPPYTFLDEAQRNKDLRIVKNQAGKTILLYSFIDKNTIVITSTENIFNAIMGKYFTGQMVR